MRIIKECDCNYKGKNCRHIGKLESVVESLKEEYETDNIVRLAVVSKGDFNWRIERTEGEARFSLTVSCDFLKESSAEEIGKLVVRGIMDEEELAEKEDECMGDCHDEDVSCKECHCPESCCVHCGLCWGDCHDRDIDCDDCRCPEECCEGCFTPCFGDCEDDDVDCENCRCPKECCDGCEGEYGFFYLSEDEKIEKVAARLGIPESKIKIRYKDVINAYTDGETIWITSGALEQLNEEEIAFTIGHEQSHIDGNHVDQQKRFIKDRAQKIEQIVSDKKSGFIMKTLKVAGSGLAAIGGFSILSHKQELEADLRSKRKTEKAGYSGEGGRDLMQRFEDMGDGNSITHPHPRLRKKILE